MAPGSRPAEETLVSGSNFLKSLQVSSCPRGKQPIDLVIWIVFSTSSAALKRHKVQCPVPSTSRKPGV